VYTWIVGGTTAETVVRWELSETNGGTLLRIDHTGFENYAESAPRMMKSAVGGWNSVAAELGRWLNGELDAS